MEMPYPQQWKPNLATTHGHYRALLPRGIPPGSAEGVAMPKLVAPFGHRAKKLGNANLQTDSRMLFEVEPTFALMIFVNTIERPESLHNRLESARWSDGPSPFPQMGDVVENAAGVSPSSSSSTTM
jgi:hypothetical protein